MALTQMVTSIGAGITFGASLTALLALDHIPVARALSTTGLIGTLLAVAYLALDGRLGRVERNADRIARLEREQLIILERILPGSPEDSGSNHTVRRIR